MVGCVRVTGNFPNEDNVSDAAHFTEFAKGASVRDMSSKDNHFQTALAPVLAGRQLLHYVIQECSFGRRDFALDVETWFTVKTFGGHGALEDFGVSQNRSSKGKGQRTTRYYCYVARRMAVPQSSRILSRLVILKSIGLIVNG